MNQIFTLKTCDSCRKATKWLQEHSIPFTEIPIRENPPTPAQLSQALNFLQGDIRKLFNTSGQDYRILNIKDKLPTLSPQQAITLLSSNGNLIKRPFLITSSFATTGFNPKTWQNLLL